MKVLAELVRRRGAPIYVRCDNGPEFISEALKRWCLRSGARTSFIEPGAPWQNAFVESFNGRMREELLNLEVFDSVFEAKVLIEGLAGGVRRVPSPPIAPDAHPVGVRSRWKEENEPRLS